MGGVAPQAFQAVEFALLVQEHVNHDVDEIHQDPFGDAAALDVLGLAPALFEEALLDRVGNRQGLTR